MASYRVLTGIDYPPGKRAEAGDVVDDLPGKSIKWLVACGAIEKADGKTARVVEEEVIEEEIVEEAAEEPMVEETVEAEEEAEESAPSVWGSVSITDDEEDED